MFLISMRILEEETEIVVVRKGDKQVALDGRRIYWSARDRSENIR